MGKRESVMRRKASRIASKTQIKGFDILTLIAILQVLLPWIAKLCAADPWKLRKRAQDRLRDGPRVPNVRIRRRLAKEGIDDREAQDKLWINILKECANSSDDECHDAAYEFAWEVD